MLWIGLGVLGLVIGSFLNVVIRRLPVMLEREWRGECRALLDEPPSPGVDEDPDTRFDLVWPRSRCPSCAQPIRAIDNIPVVSWLLLRGRCRACGRRISIEYPLVELATAVLAIVALSHFGLGWTGALAIVFSWILLTAAVIDLHTTLLPDDLTWKPHSGAPWPVTSASGVFTTSSGC